MDASFVRKMHGNETSNCVTVSERFEHKDDAPLCPRSVSMRFLLFAVLICLKILNEEPRSELNVTQACIHCDSCHC